MIKLSTWPRCSPCVPRPAANPQPPHPPPPTASTHPILTQTKWSIPTPAGSQCIDLQPGWFHEWRSSCVRVRVFACVYVLCIPICAHTMFYTSCGGKHCISCLISMWVHNCVFQGFCTYICCIYCIYACTTMWPWACISQWESCQVSVCSARQWDSASVSEVVSLVHLSYSNISHAERQTEKHGAGWDICFWTLPFPSVWELCVKHPSLCWVIILA